MELTFHFLELVMSVLNAAAEVLKCFGPDRLELTVTDVVALRSAPKSSTSRLLRAMRDAGLLETVGDRVTVPSTVPWSTMFTVPFGAPAAAVDRTVTVILIG